MEFYYCSATGMLTTVFFNDNSSLGHSCLKKKNKTVRQICIKTVPHLIKKPEKSKGKVMKLTFLSTCSVSCIVINFRKQIIHS